MSNLNVIVFIGIIRHLTYFMERFIEYANSCGINCYIVDVNKEETFNSAAFYQFATRPNTIMFTFNNIEVGLQSSSGNNFWQEKNIPVFDYIVDHPRNFEDTMLEPPCDLYVFSLDMNHVAYINRFYPKVKEAIFSPNGGTAVGKDLPYADRIIDVLYMGSCQVAVDFPLIEDLPNNGADFYYSCISMLQENTMLTTEEAIEEYFLRSNIPASEELLHKLNHDYALYIERAVRRNTKLRGMKALSDAGVHVDIYGSSWNDDAYPYSDNIIIHDRIEIDELMDLIGQAKISLCFIPWFKSGCSEKNFDSMLNGALCVSDRSNYLSEHYRDGYNIVYFDLDNPDQMAADVVWLLEHPDAAEQIAQKGKETATLYDTWDIRFENVVKKMYEVIGQNMLE